MNWPDDLDTEGLACIYLVANTPAYLYRQLRAQPSIVRLAESSSAESLLASLPEILELHERTPEDVARAYSLLAAVSLQRYSLWCDLVRQIDLSKLGWGEDFRFMMTAKAVQSDVTNLLASSQATGLSASVSAASSSGLTIRPAFAPKVTVS